MYILNTNLPLKHTQKEPAVLAFPIRMQQKKSCFSWKLQTLNISSSWVITWIYIGCFLFSILNVLYWSYSHCWLWYYWDQTWDTTETMISQIYTSTEDHGENRGNAPSTATCSHSPIDVSVCMVVSVFWTSITFNSWVKSCEFVSLLLPFYPLRWDTELRTGETPHNWFLHLTEVL